MRRDLRIVFAGGGTGGHVFPAIYMAEYFKKHWGADCQFIGTRKGIENTKVSQAGYLVRYIWISGFKRGFYLKNLIFPLKLMTSSMQSKKILNQIKPHVVIGTGGYVAGPVLRQAIKMKIPTAIQEQNSYPGLTTRLLAPHVDCVFLAYKESLAYLKNLKNYRLVGNPVRANITTKDLKEAGQYFGLRQEIPTILVFGGSRGSHNINMAIDEMLSKRILRQVQIIWQTGEINFDHYKKKYKNFKEISLCILPFIDRMDYAYSISHLAVTRAGAMTISELAAAGLPAILIPYPHATANHQLKNAQTIVNGGGALLVEDNSNLTEYLITAILTLLASPDQIKYMGTKIHAFHRNDTMAEISEELTKLLS
jgi:UDP-N-acetylglucosamine--N-acetylmuramyl-(pentapeptide) pyrophosphoryl-undecaprenol N-acetylglucosamine transferase